MKVIKILSSVRLLLGIGALFATPAQLYAQHYPAGSEGIKAGSLPPSGFYIEDYNSFYIYDKVPGFGGQVQKGFAQFDYTQTPRLIWITDWKILGANFGMAARMPFAYQQYTHRVPYGLPISVNPFPVYQTKIVTDNHFGLSDIQIEPVILSWHLKRFDISTSYSFWVPTGDFPGGRFNQNSTLFYTLGQGYWTHSFSLGITWYPDSEKTWAISLLNHYDINTAQYSGLYYEPVPGGIASLDTTLGDIYTLEWAVSKTLVKDVDIGLTGYYQQQVTATEGPTPNGPTWQNERIHVAGIGPEVKVDFPKSGLAASLRYDYEVTAMDHPQGNLITLTVSKSF